MSDSTAPVTTSTSVPNSTVAVTTTPTTTTTTTVRKVFAPDAFDATDALLEARVGSAGLSGGLIRVVLVQELEVLDQWRAYFCTDVQATVREILEAVADRSAIEIAHPHYPSSDSALSVRRLAA